MRLLESLNRGQLIQVASYLCDMADAETFDPFTDEQLRLLITSKAIESVCEKAGV